MTRRSFSILIIAAAFAVPCSSAPNFIPFQGDTYAAVAYSEKTGTWGYANGRPSRFIAETLAKRYCKAKDAEAVVWVHNGWCALALGDDGAWGIGWSSGKGATNTEAKKQALANCHEFGKNARVVLCVCSLDRKPEIFE